MKKLVTLIFFTSCLVSFSQNFNLFHPQMVRLYQSDAEALVLKFEDVTPETPFSADTLYKGYDFFAGENNCFNPGYPFWLGDPIKKKENGDVYFYNLDQQPIKINSIHTLSEGDEWECYSSGELFTPTTIRAFVVSIVEEDILGLTDIVKTIKFQAYDEDGNQLNSPINNKELKVSENYGLIKSPPFVSFPDIEHEYGIYPSAEEEFLIVGMSNPEVGRLNLTTHDIFDFQTGDELHTSYYYEGGFIEINNHYQNTIIRYLERSQIDDTLIYQAERIRWIRNVTSTDEGLDTTEYTVHDTVEQRYSPNEKIDNFPHQAFIVESNSGWDEATFNRMPSSGTKVLPADVYLKGNSSCFSSPANDGCSYALGLEDGTYRRGLGGPYFSCWVFYTEVANSLVYYKKGENEWGEPLNILSTEAPSGAYSPNEFRIYPNPSTDSFTLESTGLLKGRDVYLHIYDLSGRLKESVNIKQNKAIINHHLRTGVYFYKIIQANCLVDSGKLYVK